MTTWSRWLSDWLGKPIAPVLAGVIPVAIWAASGPFMHYSDTWQLVINTGTSVLSYLFMFMIQQAQNTGTLAVQLKLDALILATDKANNALITVETRSEAEIRRLKLEVSEKK